MRTRLLALACVFFLAPQSVSAATLYLAPESGSYPVGTEFTVEVRADSDGTPVNSAEAELSFNPAALEVVRVSTENSVLTSWPSEPAFSNDAGLVTFSGWAGQYKVHTGALLLTIRFRARQPLVGTVRFLNAAMLTADAQSTNILSTLKSGLYEGVVQEVTPQSVEAPTPVVQPSSAPNPEPSSEESVQAAASLSAPRFTEVPQTLQTGERLIVRGEVGALATIYLWLKHDDAPAQRLTVEGAADGSFVYVSTEGMEAGAYQLTAEARLPDGIQSALSEAVTFTVSSGQLGGVAAAGTYAGPISALLALIGAFLAVYFLASRKRHVEA